MQKIASGNPPFTGISRNHVIFWSVMTHPLLSVISNYTITSGKPTFIGISSNLVIFCSVIKDPLLSVLSYNTIASGNPPFTGIFRHTKQIWKESFSFFATFVIVETQETKPPEDSRFAGIFTNQRGHHYFFLKFLNEKHNMCYHVKPLRDKPFQNAMHCSAFLPWLLNSTLVWPSWLWKWICFPHV